MSQGARDPYDVLGVRPGATAEEIHQAYASTAKRIHPDNFDRQRQPDLWRAANAALVELNEAYATLSGAARQASHSAPSQPGFSMADIAEECFRRWRPSWGMPLADYDAFLRLHLDMNALVSGVLSTMRNKAGLTQQAVLGECMALLSLRGTELRRAMASWYCDRTMATRDGAIHEFNTSVHSQPKSELGRLIDHLTQMLQTAVTLMERAAVLDPQEERLQVIRTILEADLIGARDARIRAQTQPTGVHHDPRRGGPSAAPATPVKPWYKRDWKWLAVVPACWLVIALAVFHKPSKEETVRKEFSGLRVAVRDGGQTRYDLALAALVARRDTGFIGAAVSVGSDSEPGVKQAALAYLAELAPRTSYQQKQLIADFALQSLATGEEYTKGFARRCLDRFDPASLQTCLQNSVLDAARSTWVRRYAASELLLRGGSDAVAFLLDHNAEISPAVNVAVSLNDADPYDIVAGSRRAAIAQLPLVLRARISQAEKNLEASRGVSFSQVRIDGLDKGTAEIEIHNEAPVDLYLEMTPDRTGGSYSLTFPARTTRKVAVKAGSYYYRADGRRSDITGMSGAHDFAGSYSHIWVFFLDSQQAQMRAKYPDMQFR